MSYITLIGKGPIFPIELTTLPDGTVTWATTEGDTTLLLSDLTGLMAHARGSMIRQEDIGHRLNELLEEPDTEVLQQLSQKFTLEHLNDNEARINPLTPADVIIHDSQGSITQTIHATLLSGDPVSPLELNIQ